MTATGFDVEAYVSSPTGPNPEPVTAVPMPSVVAADLRLVRDSLQGANGWLSHVLVTATHKNARATAFLTTWAYEQLWLADYLGLLLGEPRLGPEMSKISRPRLYLGPLREAVLGNVYGHALTAVQMTERYVDSLLLDALLTAAAQQVAATESVIGRVQQVLARQRVFFQESAAAELAASRFARMLTRHRLRRQVFPLGVPKQQRRTVRSVLAGLNCWDKSVVTRLDAAIMVLPGMAKQRLAARLLGATKR